MNLSLLRKELLVLPAILISSLSNGQNNIGDIDDRCKTKNYRSVDGWGEYPVQAGQSTDNHDPRIERKNLTKITIGSERTFEATYKILAADNTTFAQILNRDQRNSDVHKPVVFVIAEASGNNWKLRDQSFSLGTVPKDSEFKLRIDTYYNSAKTIAYSDIYINGVKKETKKHARVGQDAQMRYGNYHHGSGTSIVRVKNVTWQTTAQYLAGGGGGGGGTNTPPTVSITSPSNNASFNLGETISFGATASDSDGSVDRVNFKINDDYHSTDETSPYTSSFTPTTAGTYVIGARAFDDKGDATEKTVTITVTASNNPPTVSITSPANNANFELGETISLGATASDSDGSVDRVNFKINDDYLSTDETAPYSSNFTPTTAGTYVIGARAFDENGDATEKTVTITVTESNNSPTVSITSPANNASFELGETISLGATASDSDGSVDRVNFKINDDYLSTDETAPYTSNFTPTTAGTYVIGARAFDENGDATEKTVTITVTEQKDCNGTPGGTASMDDCGVCSGGTTGIPVNSCNICKTVFASSDDGNVPVNVLDGNLETRWSAEGTGEFIEFCLDEETMINSLSLAFFKGNERTTTFDVEYSLNGIDYTKILSNKTSSGTTLEMEKFSFDPVNVKKLRITGKGNSNNAWNSISEVEWAELITNIKNSETNTQLNIYPNPSNSGIFYLPNDMKWTVYSIDGKLTLEGSEQIVDLHDYPEGMYILKTDNKQIMIRKM